MTTRGEELTKLLGKIPTFSVAKNTGSYFSFGTAQSNSAATSQLSSAFLSVFIMLFVLFLVLIIVHFTIRPIFRFGLAGRSLIPLNPTNDGQLVWTRGPVPADLSANVLKILPAGFTVQQDIYLESESLPANRKRVFFYRSNTAVLPGPVRLGSEPELFEQYPETNLIMYLLPQTNDLVVSAITKKGNETFIESAPTILNVPVRQPFRLTVVFLQNLIEVYLNGRLVGAKTLRYAPRPGTGYFFGPPDIFRKSVRTMNFQYWDRPLLATEVENAPPALAGTDVFGPTDIQAMCGVTMASSKGYLERKTTEVGNIFKHGYNRMMIFFAKLQWAFTS